MHTIQRTWRLALMSALALGALGGTRGAAPVAGGTERLAAPAEGAARPAGPVDPTGKLAPAGHAASAPEELRLYAPNQKGASVSVLDGHGRGLTTVHLPERGFSSHPEPHQVAASGDGSSWYVTLVGDDYVAKFDHRHRPVGRARFEAPGMLVLDEGRDRLYVSRALAAVDPPSSLGVFRASDLELLEEVEVFVSRPHGLAVDSVSGRVYAASVDANRIAVYDPADGRVEVKAVPEAPNGFVGLDTSPDGSRLVATAQIVDRLLAFDVGGPEGLRRVATVPVEPGPYDVAYSPDGRFVWFPNQRADAVTRVETGGWTVDAVVRSEGFVEPHGVILSPDGRRAYVTSPGRPGDGPSRSAGTVVVLDAERGTVRAVTETGPYTTAPGLAPVGPGGAGR